MSTLNTGTATTYDLDFERPLTQLANQISELEAQSHREGFDLGVELRKARQNHTDLLKKIYENLSPWNTVRVARHPSRPQSADYINAFVKDFCELHGDRNFGDDRAIITGFGRIGPHKVLIVAHNKGRETKERIACNFGMAHPEGYRKAMVKMKLAEKYNVPIVTFVDTPGAYPGVGAEERGQAEAIAYNLREMSRLKVPVISAILAEGGSGGALGIGVADKVAMLQYAWYSVISPEGCSSILWKSAENTADAAVALHLTSKDNKELGTIDDVIEEPLGGAHRNPQATADKLEKWIIHSLRDLKKIDRDTLVDQRYKRLRLIGKYQEEKQTQ